MSKWEQNAVFEYSEYICLVKRINGIVAQKTLVTELVRCKECKHWQTDWNPEEGVGNFHFCPMVDRSIFDDWYCADGERKESE